MWHLIEQLLPLFPFLAMLWSPCCCSTGCTFFSDDFAVDDLATAYTSVSGSWAISSGNLHTASSSAVLTGNTANPNSDSNTKISVTVNIATDGDTARIILDYQNSSNYWFAEVKAGTGAYLKIIQRSGGANTDKATASITLATGSFGFCASIVNGSIFTASIDGVTSLGFTDTFTQTGWGLGTGTLGGTVTFDDLSVGIAGTGCPPCSLCTACIDSIVPGQIKAVIAGMVNNTCTTCATYNGTFYLPLFTLNPGPFTCVQYVYTITSGTCASGLGDHKYIRFNINYAGGPGRYIGEITNQAVTTVGFHQLAGWATGNYSDPASDCVGLLNQSLANYADSGICDASASTFTASAA